jgi:hypothetical protein
MATCLYIPNQAILGFAVLADEETHIYETKIGISQAIGDVWTKEKTNMWAKFLGTINLSSPTSALPVALILLSPFAVSGSSVVPVCLPFKDHSVSPWRTTNTRGVVMFFT